MRTVPIMTLIMIVVITTSVDAWDTNDIYDPCSDAKILKSDGFTLGLAFSSKESFFFEKIQLSPCDRRLSLSTKIAQLAVFRPKDMYGGYMVAFAGRKYAARSQPTFVANSSYIITSFTLVLEFQKGTLQNLHWKKDGCATCAGKSSFICLNLQDCATRISNCQSHGGPFDCSLGIQLAFSESVRSTRESWLEII
uniref:Expp1 protein n=1 Tax=Nelumbo nucifera TaxID=4432 RepID=A0A822ZQT7_NELNU|nr:TPA_asm: hypothetical protein HUJ06_016807 [Nelumbo nucifera]